MRVLITCGPTWVPIDQVRVISNHSSGEMGHLIAREFLKVKAQVTVLEGQVTHAWNPGAVRIVKYRYFDELQKLLKIELKKKYDCVVHAAAVSDFKLKALQGKVDSAKPLSLKLVPAPKLINEIKKIAPKIFLVGFKLDPGLTLARLSKETQSLFKVAQCDLVVANSLEGGYQGFIVNQKGQILAKAANKNNLAKRLVHAIHHSRS